MLKEIVKVIYAPHKAFKEITQNPKYLGPILIMILFIAANFALSYTLLSKTYIDKTEPEEPSKNFDLWTEEKSYWSSTAKIEVNTDDFINGSYYGNKSIEFQLTSSSQIFMELNITEGLSCLGPEGYKNLTFRVKIVEPADIPSNASLYLISDGQGSFYKNISNVVNVTNAWNNVTLSLGNGWEQLGSPNWNNITCLRLEFTWPNNYNIKLLIDGLFFHGLYKSQMETSSNLLIDLVNPYSPINAFIQFTIQWVFLGGLLYLIPKVFGAKTVWRPLLIAAGFILMIYFVRTVVFAIVYAVAPDVYLPLAYLGGVSNEWRKAYEQIYQAFAFPYMVLWSFDKFIWIWAIALCTILFRSLDILPWRTSIFSAVSSFILYLLLLILFTPAPPILL